MRNLIKIFPCVLLLACAKKPTVVDTQYNSIQNQVDAVKESLPEECMTPAVRSQFIAIETQLTAQREACNAAVDAEKKQKEYWTLTTYMLAALIIFLSIKRT